MYIKIPRNHSLSLSIMENNFSLQLLLLMAVAITNLRLISTATERHTQPPILPPPIDLAPPPTTTITSPSSQLIPPPPTNPPPPPTAITSPSFPPIPPPLPSQPTNPPPPPTATIISPPPPPTATITLPPPPPPPLSPAELREQLLNNIIDALIGAGDFAGWANILSGADPSTFPLTATLFIPGNDAFSHLPTATAAGINFDPFLIPYHIVPERLSFSDLQLFHSQTRLPTLFPSKTLIITNNSSSDFTIDNSPITHPDLYVTSAICVHGVGNILDYSIYGDNFYPPPPLHPIPRPPSPPFFPYGEVIERGRSDAACLCVEFPIVLSVLYAAFAFKIHRNPPTS